MLLRLLILSIFAVLGVYTAQSQSSSQQEFLKKVNGVRASGCWCGTEYMPSAQRLKYNSKLNRSAYLMAKEMHDLDYFDHQGPNGDKVDSRIEAQNYDWKLVGENLGKGQKSVREIFQDWIESPSHCKMLMNGRFREMGFARFNEFWVQHLGLRINR